MSKLQCQEIPLRSQELGVRRPSSLLLFRRIYLHPQDCATRAIQIRLVRRIKCSHCSSDILVFNGSHRNREGSKACGTRGEFEATVQRFWRSDWESPVRQVSRKGSTPFTCPIYSTLYVQCVTKVALNCVQVVCAGCWGPRYKKEK